MRRPSRSASKAPSEPSERAPPAWLTNLTWWATLGVVIVRPVALGLIVFGLGVSGPAAAWHSAPLKGEPDAPVWTGWLGAGGGARELGPATGSVRPVIELRAGLGLEASSAHISRYHELKVGYWIQATGDLGGALGEGGLELALTKEVYDGSFYGLRAGGGYGVGPSDRGAAIVGTMLFGRRHTWGECAYLYRARGWRAFATARYWPTEGRGLTIVAGMEIDPSLFFSDDDDDYWGQLNHRSPDHCVRGL